MKPINVMVNGLPGNVAQLIASHVMADHMFELMPFSLTGPEITASTCRVGASDIRLIRPDVREKRINEIKDAYASFISVDFTHPAAVNTNAAFYCSNGLPFVMGTTGGDRKRLEETVNASSIAAVISPNMAKQIVGFQAMMAYAAETFPDLFMGYTATIRESHQKGKADTSGTAKAIAGYINALGAPVSEGDIVRERDPETQKNTWGVPERYLTGHGYHTYRLVSPDNTVRFEFTHNVNGRDVYGRGTLDAIAYLKEKIDAGVSGRVFSMIDVLKRA